MNRTIACVGTLAAAIFSFASSAQASPIRYELSGSASGKIGTTMFTDATVDLVATGDTADVVQLTEMGITLYANPFETFAVTIGGIGTATILDASELWAVPVTVPGSSANSAVLFGRIDNPPALDSITGIGYDISVALSGYTGATDIGPITDEGAFGFNPACSTPGNDPCIHTTLGLLRFTSNPSPPVTTETTFTATPVPEPTTLLLLGIGMGGLVGRIRSRHRISRS